MTRGESRDAMLAELSEVGVQRLASEDGFEVGFVVTFASLGDRNFYVGEPIVEDPRYYDRKHAEFKRFIVPLLAQHRGAEILDFAVTRTLGSD